MLYLLSIGASSELTIPKNSFYWKAIERLLQIKGVLGLSVNKSTLGTEGLSLMKVSALVDDTSITLD